MPKILMEEEYGRFVNTGMEILRDYEMNRKAKRCLRKKIRDSQ